MVSKKIAAAGKTAGGKNSLRGQNGIYSTNFMEPHLQRKGRSKPARLGEKLRRIRQDGGLSQGQMLIIVNPDERTAHNRARVSQYERMKRLPSLIETHNYARYAGVPVEVLIDDNLELPDAGRRRPATAAQRKKGRRKKEKSSEKVGKKRAGKSNAGGADKVPTVARQDSPGADSKPTAGGDTDADAEDDGKDETAMTDQIIETAAPAETAAATVETAATTEVENEAYQDNLLALPLIIEANLPTEELRVELPLETLDQLDDLFLEILRELPRRRRSAVTVSDVVNFCIRTILTNYADYQKNSLVMFRTRMLIEDSEEEKSGGEKS